MRIAYVLPTPELNGGNKVAFQHARLLEEGGDEVTVLAHGERPGWSAVRNYRDLSAGGASGLPSQDLVIATYWTTLATVGELGLGRAAHFCQGFEGDFSHLLTQRAAIEQAYREPLPTLVVTPHLARLLGERFGRECRVVPPPLDRDFRPHRFRRLRRRPWIALPGIFEAEVKNVTTAIAAIAELKRRGLDCRLLRISTWPLSEEERALFPPDRLLSGVPPREVARQLPRCDLLLLPSRAEEGFGLPLLEAMAAGVPAVASRIPSTEFMSGGAVDLVDPEDPMAFADAAEALLRSPALWRAARRRGLAAAERFAPEAVARELHAATRWAAGVAP